MDARAYRRMMREKGVYTYVGPGDPLYEKAAAHAEQLHDKGMSYSDIAIASGLSSYIPGRKMHRTTAAKLLTAKAIARRTRRIAAVGVLRRLEALHVEGFSIPAIADVAGMEYCHLNSIQRHYKYVAVDTHRKVDQAYRVLEGKDAYAFGRPAWSIERAKAIARDRDYAPRICWDSDTIDDPGAIPEYTGHCGTTRGYKIHQREGGMFRNATGSRLVAACRPCSEAHYQAVKESRV